MTYKDVISILKTIQFDKDGSLQLGTWYNGIGDDYNKAIEIAIEVLSQQEWRWVPCSERLPEDLEEVNVTWVNHEPESYYEFAKDKPFTASAVYYKGDWYWYSSTCADILAEYGENDIDKVDDAVEIIAWKPWPKPYMPES